MDQIIIGSTIHDRKIAFFDRISMINLHPLRVLLVELQRLHYATPLLTLLRETPIDLVLHDSQLLNLPLLFWLDLLHCHISLILLYI